MNSLSLTIGLPGATKSTFCSHLPKETIIVSSDLIRESIFGDINTQEHNKEVFYIAECLIKYHLASGKNVVLDATNLTKKNRAKYIEIAKEFGVETQCYFFDIPIEICKERNRNRDRVVPDYVIDNMVAKLEIPTFEEGFDNIITIK